MVKSFLTFCLVLISFSAFTQYSYNGGGNISLAANAFKYDAGVGLGVSGELLKMFSEKIAIRGYAGYESFIYRYHYEDIDFIPLRAGLQYFPFAKGFAFADGGAGIFSGKYNSYTIFMLSGGAGYRLKLRTSHYLQFSIFYTYGNTKDKVDLGWTSFRMAYGFTQIIKRRNLKE